MTQRRISQETQALFVISVAAELAGVHPQTLRIYERRGLIMPFRTPGGTRRYSQEDLNRLALIQELTDQGLNLEGVKKVLELRERVMKLEKELSQIKVELSAAEDQVDREIAKVHRSYRRDIILRRQLHPDVRRRLKDLFE
ncbi:MAG: MerR family transcriptional regulator [Acidimicrobiia bacterium]|nr:MerR family transcriptional regulator [Acidimicrobiia bacterium]MDH3399229.1 MerR family transcriptional regulator [Acidimicrobiia bacterium]MDH5615307.1 MerR family transcriptional regulator [Acidimicrobiia bacterium]